MQLELCQCVAENMIIMVLFYAVMLLLSLQADNNDATTFSLQMLRYVGLWETY